jgi:hypothetical protein
MSEDITATLYLSTDQIHQTRTDTNVSNTIGGWSDGRATFWFHLKLRTLLGEAFDKYDYFMLSYVSNWLNNSVSLVEARPILLQVGGLNWVHSSYEQSTLANNYWITLPGQQMGAGANSTTGVIYDPQSQFYMFRKQDADITLYFRYIDMRTNAPYSGISLLPSAQLLFKIQPFKQ